MWLDRLLGAIRVLGSSAALTKNLELMIVESLLLAVGLAVGLLPLLVGLYRPRSRVKGIIAVAFWLAASATFASTLVKYRRPPAHEQLVTDRPIEVQEDHYVSSRTCRACHPRAYATWHASYHRTMTQVATPQSVVGDFDGVELRFAGRTYRLERRGDSFWVDMDDPNWTGNVGDPPRVQRRIVMTTGSHHLQIYWYATGHNRELGMFAFDYRIAEQRWIPDHASFLQPPWPSHQRYPAASSVRWDKSCIKCHTTHGKPRLDVTGSLAPDTHVAEFGIACEACHGPAEQHVRLNRDPLRRYRLHVGDEPDASIVRPDRLSHDLSSQVCGQCHSVFDLYDDDVPNWRNHGFRYRPGDELTKTRHIIRASHDPYQPVTRKLRERDPTLLKDAFWSDGMVRVSGREYTGMIESPCYQRGDLSCMSCHAMHMPADDPRPLSEWADDQLAPGMEGNRACLQCHDEFNDKLSEHTHHTSASTGSLCYNCHMPHTTYGVLKAIRSHQIDSPTISATRETGRPNACNLCHLDKPLSWTAEYLEKWYTTPQPEPTTDERSFAASVLSALRGDAGERALTAWSMGWKPAHQTSGTDWLSPYLIQLLLDPYPAVRFIAYRSLRGLPGFYELEYDFVGSHDERFQAVLRAGKIWKRLQMKHGTASLTTGDAILIGPQGTVNVDVFSALLSERDDRVMILRE